jgi:hypothetical protein
MVARGGFAGDGFGRPGKKEILRRAAPQDDGQGRFGWLDSGLGEAERFVL